MPTTLTGLLIFVVLLAPGFVYVLVTERGPFSRTSQSVLREMSSIALVSLLCDLVALGLYVPFAAVSGGRLASLGALMEDGASRWANDRVSMVLTMVGLLLVACLAALALAGLVNHTSGFAALKKRKPISWILPATGARTVSAWWVVLRQEHPHLNRRVTCYLQDGSRVRGWLRSFNPSADETEDRELILTGPIRITAIDGTRRWLKTGLLTVSARQIQYLHVDYYPSQPTVHPETSDAEDPGAGEGRGAPAPV